MSLKQIIHCFLSAGVVVFASCGSTPQQQQQGPPPVATVTAQTVTTNAAVYYDDYPATVTAFNQTDLRSQVSGFVTGIYFKDGEHVKKGQKLYTFDQQQFQANYQQAVANLQVQQTNLLKAQKDTDRYHELDKKDAIAKQQVDYADAALEAAKKQVDAAEANVRAVQTAVNYSAVYAPFDGTIGISQVKVGSPVNAGQTILNTGSAGGAMAVDVAVDQSQIFRFTKLQQEGMKEKDSSFRLQFGGEVYPVGGKISLIDRAVDPQTGTIKMRLEFANDKGELKAGMSGILRVLNNSGVQSVVIPYKAITEQLGEFFVYVINDSSKVTQRRVVVGKQIGTNVIIKNGLSGGERIAVQGVQNLREGAAVKIDTALHAN